jgi:CheY-like chemotaxis protein
MNDTNPPSQRAVASRKRVLVVEDNPDVAEMTVVMLESFGHEVRMTHRVDDALAVVDTWSPEIIVSDIGLPDVDGFALAERIRSRPALPCRPLLVAISGYGRDIDRVRARDVGFDVYLIKPVDAETLSKVLSHAYE